MSTTSLNKPVTRQCQAASDAGRRLVVTLLPGDTIGFRLVRGRQQYCLPLLSCYYLAVRAAVMARRHERTKVPK